MNGFSIYFCFGRYAGFYITQEDFVLRIVLGWFAIGIMARDIEILHKDLCDYILEVEKNNTSLVFDSLHAPIQGDPASS